MEVIARAVVLRDGAVLLVQEIAQGYWFFPGGHVEAGETPEEALVRELREELDVAAGVENSLGEVENRWLHDGVEHHEVNHVFVTTIDTADPGQPGAAPRRRDGSTSISSTPPTSAPRPRRPRPRSRPPQVAGVERVGQPGVVVAAPEDHAVRGGGAGVHDQHHRPAVPRTDRRARCRGPATGGRTGGRRDAGRRAGSRRPRPTTSRGTARRAGRPAAGRRGRAASARSGRARRPPASSKRAFDPCATTSSTSARDTCNARHSASSDTHPSASSVSPTRPGSCRRARDRRFESRTRSTTSRFVDRPREANAGT